MNSTPVDAFSFGVAAVFVVGSVIASRSSVIARV
jgi:hypothetical protein